MTKLTFRSNESTALYFRYEGVVSLFKVFVLSMFQGSFLSVQPAAHLHFLSRFLETSMFSSFVDGKVISRWADRDPMQQLFDNRLERERLYDTDEEDSRSCRYRKCTSIFESGTVRMPVNIME